MYNNPPELRGLKTEDIFCEKCPQTWLFLGEKWPKSGSKFEKMAQKNLIGENGGERKINPSANPGYLNICILLIIIRSGESRKHAIVNYRSNAR